MFLEAFGLERDPFLDTADPSFYYDTLPIAHGRRRLAECLRSGRGLAVVVGPIGVGKTTLQNAVQHELLEDDRNIVGLILDPTFGNEAELLLAIIATFGFPKPAGTSVLSIKDSLKRALFETTASGRQPILFIDEAQLLPEPLLQTLRSLLNYQLDERKLLCIALSGQPELRDMVVRHPNFGDRVAFWLELGALSEAESAGLVHHRLRRAGFSASQSPFDDEALHVLWIKSAGIPRRLTTLARESLEVGAEYGRRQIRAADVLVAVERIVPLAATLRSDNGIAASSSRPATWSLRRLWQRFTGAL